MIRAAFRHPVGFMTDHRFTRARASDYLDDALEPSQQRRIEAHINACPACMRLIGTLRRTVVTLRTLAPPRPRTQTVSEGVLARFRRVLDEPPVEPGEKRHDGPAP